MNSLLNSINYMCHTAQFKKIFELTTYSILTEPTTEPLVGQYYLRLLNTSLMDSVWYLDKFDASHDMVLWNEWIDHLYGNPRTCNRTTRWWMLLQMLDLLNFVRNSSNFYVLHRPVLPNIWIGHVSGTLEPVTESLGGQCNYFWWFLNGILQISMCHVAQFYQMFGLANSSGISKPVTEPLGDQYYLR